MIECETKLKNYRDLGIILSKEKIKEKTLMTNQRWLLSRQKKC